MKSRAMGTRSPKKNPRRGGDGEWLKSVASGGTSDPQKYKALGDGGRVRKWLNTVWGHVPSSRSVLVELPGRESELFETVPTEKMTQLLRGVRDKIELVYEEETLVIDFH